VSVALSLRSRTSEMLVGNPSRPPLTVAEIASIFASISFCTIGSYRRFCYQRKNVTDSASMVWEFPEIAYDIQCAIVKGLGILSI
jgi:hypothetical protein